MNSVDLSPLYRNSIGFDRMASLIDNALRADTGATGSGHPPYNIEMLDENRYCISLAVAGFTKDKLDIQMEKGVLTIRGNKPSNDDRNYLYQGIANRPFEYKFTLADYVEVVDAALSNGLLKISLVKEIPEAMKPKNISIKYVDQVLEHQTEEKSDTKGDKAA